MQTLAYEALTPEEQQLITAAQEALTLSYNPTSHKLVGAAVQTVEGATFKNGNFYSSVTAVNICAERTAIIAANAAGKRDIKRLAVIGKSDTNVFNKPMIPCGICRQFLLGITTMNGHDIDILCVNPQKTEVMKTSVSELLPLGDFNI